MLFPLFLALRAFGAKLQNKSQGMKSKKSTGPPKGGTPNGGSSARLP
jgi:hypothetical protein